MFKVVLLFRQIRKLQNEQKHQLNLKAFRIFLSEQFYYTTKSPSKSRKKRHLPLFILYISKDTLQHISAYLLKLYKYMLSLR